MNKHYAQSILKFISLIVTILSSGCGQSTIIDSPTLTPVPSQTPTEIAKITPTESVAKTLISTPTARVFKQVNDCNSLKDSGHIFFFRANSQGKRNHASYYDLYVMDGNGCYPRFVMSEVSGSPAWSVDNKWLAVGCENNSFICVLDIKATLDTCDGSDNKIGQCKAVVLQKYALPSTIAGDERMYNISWSPDSSQLIAEGGSEIKHQYFVYLLTLSNGGAWKISVQGLQVFNMAWSPKNDQLAYSGLSFINLQSTNVALGGFVPEWSPDGKTIAFVKNSYEENKEPSGISIVSIDNGNWKWVYEPVLRDQYYYPPHMLVIRDDGGDHRLLSWSPDEQYIAFVSETAFGAQSHIFRLNIATGEIVNLTAKLVPPLETQAYYAPAWGP